MKKIINISLILFAIILIQNCSRSDDSPSGSKKISKIVFREYDTNNTLQSTTDFGYEYDNQGDLIKANQNNGSNVEIYDYSGSKLVKKSNYNNNKLNFYEVLTYDGGKLKNKIEYNTSNEEQEKVEYIYNSSGQVIEYLRSGIIYPTPAKFVLQYQNDNVVKLTESTGISRVYTFDNNINPYSVFDKNLNIVNYNFNKNNILSEKLYSPSGVLTATSTNTITYNKDGTPKSMRCVNSNHPSVYYTYDYYYQ